MCFDIVIDIVNCETRTWSLQSQKFWNLLLNIFGFYITV